jgi:hypothetical protein
MGQFSTSDVKPPVYHRLLTQVLTRHPTRWQGGRFAFLLSYLTIQMVHQILSSKCLRFMVQLSTISVIRHNSIQPCIPCFRGCRIDNRDAAAFKID